MIERVGIHLVEKGKLTTLCGLWVDIVAPWLRGECAGCKSKQPRTEDRDG